MTRAEIESRIQESGADITVFDLTQVDALIVDCDGLHVGISSRISERRQKAGLAHELGHIKRGGLYQIKTPPLLRQKAECLADRYAAYALATPEEIKRAVSEGYAEEWELADYFDLPYDVMHDIISGYRLRGELGA